MRLTASEVDAIKTCAKTVFAEGVSVRLFGSRTNDAAAGGDIDLYIEPPSDELSTLRNELAFKLKLMDAIGDQRIDVVLRSPMGTRRPIDRIASETGIPLL